MKYKIHMVSFASQEHSGSYGTLMIGAGERPQPWQWELLAQWVKENETQSVDDGSDLA